MTWPKHIFPRWYRSLWKYKGETLALSSAFPFESSSKESSLDECPKYSCFLTCTKKLGQNCLKHFQVFHTFRLQLVDANCFQIVNLIQHLQNLQENGVACLIWLHFHRVMGIWSFGWNWKQVSRVLRICQFVVSYHDKLDMITYRIYFVMEQGGASIWVVMNPRWVHDMLQIGVQLKQSPPNLICVVNITRSCTCSISS